MPQYTFQFRGWHAIIGAVVFLGYLAVSSYARVRAVDDGLRDSLRQYLLNEYSGRGLGDVQRLLSEAHNGQAVENLREVEQHDVEFSSISAVGKYLGEYETVRVRITLDGGPPPQGPGVRYFRVEQILSGKWLVVGQSDSYSYYSEQFPFL